MKSRFLTPGEKRDVVAAALDVLKAQNPGRHIHIDVEDWTDDRGVPQWKATFDLPRAGEETKGGTAKG
jgi:hypothetical protein